jgi:hypothetical protein
MRKLLVLALGLAVIATPVLAARRVHIVPAAQAGQSQGNLAAVRGRARIRPDITNQGTDIDLIDANGRVVFVGFIPKLNEYAFPQVAGLDGRTVVMYGIIELYQGVPATQLIFSDQLHGS